jgi:hypothetical protein
LLSTQGVTDAEAALSTRQNALTELAGVSVKPPSAVDKALFYCVYWSMCVTYALKDYSILYLVGYVIASIMGCFVNEFCFAYHLGDVVIRNETVKVCCCSQLCASPVGGGFRAMCACVRVVSVDEYECVARACVRACCVCVWCDCVHCVHDRVLWCVVLGCVHSRCILFVTVYCGDATAVSLCSRCCGL